ncbi:hypothetical protein BOTNAR_0199g00050 [Botryotinia narcissicola]|uniref:Uncharacterized protein n=1 Tax=Botryotinia narcissicola TaxID=278944 RepID=A0A4Z1IA09_9HELO|nr:hypothetical protein BOTNAR_0199g00050 [Botryotinia narcissicola]
MPALVVSLAYQCLSYCFTCYLTGELCGGGRAKERSVTGDSSADENAGVVDLTGEVSRELRNLTGFSMTNLNSLFYDS